ncbi:transposase family protein [Arthrobacter sp. Z4-13]
MIIETDQLPGCPSCGVIASRRKERRLQRLRGIPVAGPVDVLWSKYRWYCDEVACDRLSFFESTPQVPCRARSTARLRDQLVDAVIRSGRAVSETAARFAVSWWMVRAAVTETCLLQLPDMDRLSPRMLGTDERRFRSVRYFQDPSTKACPRFEPWMTTIVDLDTGQVPGVAARWRYTQLPGRPPTRGSVRPGRSDRHPPGRLESQGTTPGPAPHRLPRRRCGGQEGT